ncbi:FumA C-terminus/TtdB family hydratase beta subunit [Fervidobacterium sp.]|uniref:FumA C-terminus/TtdB family hydratase beta subunit n=1 Tax=Fervidobacterium sp. TaxID=1871331 RepID=UPI0025BF0E6D|nr:FumA C-terminus/TtdB family hydratase beta subunit [Fervidobacterium sp.]
MRRMDKIALCDLKAGESFYYSGTLLVMRDAAHKRIIEEEKETGRMRISLDGKIIFYAGPTFSNGRMIIGPTTSKRMDKFLEYTLSKGVIATIGKGERTHEAIEAIKKYRAPYLVAPSGCAAYLSEKILDWKIVAFEELGPEAIYEITVKDFPLVVAIDCNGNLLRQNG